MIREWLRNMLRYDMEQVARDILRSEMWSRERDRQDAELLIAISSWARENKRVMPENCTAWNAREWFKGEMEREVLNGFSEKEKRK